MNVKQLRWMAESVIEQHGGDLGEMCVDLLRILDAFEAMDKLGCDLVWWDDYGEPVVFKNGETLLEVFLNSAAATLEDKSDG